MPSVKRKARIGLVLLRTIAKYMDWSLKEKEYRNAEIGKSRNECSPELTEAIEAHEELEYILEKENF